MKKYQYRYCFEKVWDENSANSYETYYDDHEAAEEICEERDVANAEYPDEQTLWLWREGDEFPREFTVWAEMPRNYSARAKV